MSEDDWRLDGGKEYLIGRAMKWATWLPTRDGWDHDHCEFCWAELSDRPIDDHTDFNAGWVSDDGQRWVCPKCFDDFRQRFGWVISDPA